MQISKTRELKITCMHNSRQYYYSVYSKKPYLLYKHEHESSRGKTAKLRVMPVIQWRSVAWFLISNNGAHVQIFWSAVNKSIIDISAHEEPPERSRLLLIHSWTYTQDKFLANSTDKIPPARIFDTFDKFLTADLRLYFPGEQPKPQFPASKIFSVEQIL